MTLALVETASLFQKRFKFLQPTYIRLARENYNKFKGVNIDLCGVIDVSVVDGASWHWVLKLDDGKYVSLNADLIKELRTYPKSDLTLDSTPSDYISNAYRMIEKADEEKDARYIIRAMSNRDTAYSRLERKLGAERARLWTMEVTKEINRAFRKFGFEQYIHSEGN